MEFISIKKLKFYTKETIKFFNLTLLALGFIIAIVFIKYKPMYEVKLSGEKIGYVNSKKTLEEAIISNIENYEGKNIENIQLTQKPEYELKLVEKTKESQDSEVIIAMQKNVEITYNYYEIAVEDKIIEKVDTEEIAESIVSDIAKVTSENINININKKTTDNIDEIKTNSLEEAKSNIIEELGINNEKEITNINGIKIASLPVSGIISSRYGESSSIRSSRHTGLDIAASKGTPIQAIADGTVTCAAYTGSYGYLVKINHGNGIESWYAHTSKMYVTVGQEVKAGDTIALVGSTGNSTGPHLHLEIRIDGKAVNPQLYLYK